MDAQRKAAGIALFQELETRQVDVEFSVGLQVNAVLKAVPPELQAAVHNYLPELKELMQPDLTAEFVAVLQGHALKLEILSLGLDQVQQSRALLERVLPGLAPEDQLTAGQLALNLAENVAKASLELANACVETLERATGLERVNG